MKKIISTLTLCILCVSCAYVPADTGVTFLGTTKESSMVTANAGSKTGETCGMNILGLVATGDTSVNTAKKNGRITRVSSVDKKIERYLVFAKVCTIVKGN